MIFFHSNFQEHEIIPLSTYKLTAATTNEAFDYKETKESIKLDKVQSLNDDTYSCNFVTGKIRNSVTQTMAASSQGTCDFLKMKN